MAEPLSLKDSGASCPCKLSSGVATCAKVGEISARNTAMIRNMSAPAGSQT
jgi:hypothetical protein